MAKGKEKATLVTDWGFLAVGSQDPFRWELCWGECVHHMRTAGSVTLLVELEEATLTDAAEARTGMLTSWATI